MPLTRLEALPTEIIILVFRYTDFAINLPLASPILGAKLSSKQTYKEVFAFAFPRSAIRTLRFDTQSESQDLGKVQTEILQRRWCTLSLLEDVERIRKTSMSGEDTESSGCSTDRIPVTRYYHLQLYSGTLLPAKVLHGPWDSSKVAFLQYLLRRGARVDWENTSLGEVAKSSLYEAVRDNNLVVTGLLLHGLIRIIPSADLIRYAVVEGGCNRSIVIAMLRCTFLYPPEERESLVDTALWRWAEIARDSGRWEGEWLMETLRMVDETGFPLPVAVDKADKHDDFIDLRIFWHEDLRKFLPETP